MFPQLVNMLSWWQWLIMAAIPPAIVALYFLKLKRKPLEVPSTFLWHKSIEDLHVNAIWQRLRRNLLLFLQLLLILLAMLAVLRPGWRGEELPGDRFVFLIDNSASMQATDAEPSRLAAAKRRAAEIVERMKSGDAGMVVSFAEGARVEQMFTDDRRQLRRAIEAVQPTVRSTSLVEALQVASGLANPGRTAYDATDIQAAEALPATVYIFSDGRVDDAREFNLGNLTPIFTPVGVPGTANVAIVAFSVRHHETRPNELQAFARLQNFGNEQVQVALELQLDGRMIDADQVALDKNQTRGVAFDLGVLDAGVLTLRATTADRLALDDVAWAAVNPPRRARVLFVTPGNEPLETALATQAAADLAEVTVESPAYFEGEPYRQAALLGSFDLVIYDRCVPKTLPHANTLFIGSLPPGDRWRSQEPAKEPMIIDIDPAHPITQFLDLGDVVLVSATPLAVPPGGDILIDSDAGPLLAIAPREAFEDAVLGFTLVDQIIEGGAPKLVIGTNWPIRPSFPTFVLNLLEYLGGGAQAFDASTVQPGKPAELQRPEPGQKLEVRTPAGMRVPLTADSQGKVTFTATDTLGVYEVRAGDKVIERFAVNLFNPAESRIAPSPTIEVGFKPADQATADAEVTRRELWKPLLMFGLVVLCIEWYVYNRRIYM